MDDLLDLSPLEQELEALSAIYLDELKLCRGDNNEIQGVELLLHPATGADTTKQFVCMNLVLLTGSKYPDEVPEIHIRNPRGLGEEEVVSLVEDMKVKARESVGEMMLYDLIEMAKETLTEGNIPHCPCVVCLEHFHKHDLFHRTACYHYFHTRCLHKYLEHSRLQIEEDRKEAAEQKHLNPKEDKEEVVIVCPVCRTAMDNESLAVCYSGSEEEEEEDCSAFTPALREQQQRMSELFEKQKAKGGIIDLELEKNKYLVYTDEQQRVPSQVGLTGLERSSEDNSCQQDNETKIPLKDEEGHRASDRHQGSRGRGHSKQSGKPPWRRHDQGSKPREFDPWRDRGRGRGGREQNHFTNGKRENVRREERRDGRKENDRWEMRRDGVNKDVDSNSESFERTGLKSDDLLEDGGREWALRESVSDKPSKDRDHDSGYESRRDKWNEDRRDNWRRDGGGRGGNGGKYDHRQQRDDDGGGVRVSGYGRGVGNRNYTDSSSSSDGKERPQAASSNGEAKNRGCDSTDKLSRRGGGLSEADFRNVREGGERQSGGGRGIEFRQRDERGKPRCNNKNQIGAPRQSAFRDQDCERLGSGEETNDRFKKQHGRGDERYQRHKYHNDHGGYSAGRGRGAPYNGGENRRGPGYRGDRDGERNRSDQGGRGSSGLLGDKPCHAVQEGEEEDDAEEKQRRQSDVKSAEINRHWRELNFGKQNSRDGGCVQNGYHVVNDDVEDHVVNACNGDNKADGYDEGSISNPHYKPENKHLFYSVASSSEEEDWEQERDPFAFERFRVRPEHYEEYSKYKQQQLDQIDKKITQRAAMKNVVLEEGRRINQERNRRERAQGTQQTAIRSEHESDGMSFVDKFKSGRKEKDNENRNNQKRTTADPARQTPEIRAREVNSGELSQDAFGNVSDKSLSLATRPKGEGIKFVGVRSNMDNEVGYDVDPPACGGVSENNAFEESWKRREEKRRREQTRPRRDKAEQHGVDKRESYSGKSNSHSHRNKNDKTGSNTRNSCQQNDKIDVLNGEENSSERGNAGLKSKHENSFSSTDSRARVTHSHEEQTTSSLNGRNDHDKAHKAPVSSHRNMKKTKPLDFRKKPSQFSSKTAAETLCDEFPSLLIDSSGGSNLNHRPGDHGIGNIDRTTLTEKAVSSNCDNMYSDADGTRLSNKISNSKKPKPLDFRKGKSKALL